MWDSMFGRPPFAIQWHVPKLHCLRCLIISNILKFTRKINVIEMNYVTQVLKLLWWQNSMKFPRADSSVKMWSFWRHFGNYPRSHLQDNILKMGKLCRNSKPWRHCLPQKILSNYVFQKDLEIWQNRNKNRWTFRVVNNRITSVKRN